MQHSRTVSNLTGEGLSLDPINRAWMRGTKPLRQAALLTLLCALPLCAASTLEERSPYLPHDHNKKEEKPPPPVQKNGPLAREIEFRGVAQINDVYQFSIFDKTAQQSHWIKMGSTKEGIKITNFDAKNMSVTLNKNGRTEKISLMESSDSPMPVAVSAPPAATKPTAGQQPTGIPGVTNNTTTNRNTVVRRRVVLPKK
ncbi:MAG: hypothetical protein ACSHX8_01080 [Opitutaceae bacterium]